MTDPDRDEPLAHRVHSLSYASPPVFDAKRLREATVEAYASVLFALLYFVPILGGLMAIAVARMALSSPPGVHRYVAWLGLVLGIIHLLAATAMMLLSLY